MPRASAAPAPSLPRPPRALAAPGRRKRLLDLALVLLALPLWAPLVGLLALLVWVRDGRPVLFRQVRIGRQGRPFVIWKLRTMTLDAAPAARRPTALGRHLRRHGIDELPQLFNVLRGDMSLVGPRPLVPEDASRLAAGCAQFSARLALVPGLTGLPQVCGARGAALTAALDGHYARRWTLSLDVAILLATVWINLVGKQRGRRPLPPELSAPAAQPDGV
jgi:lipopolysaccharide/colanic/teichoic acid biosynthesis glycosyltransferase